MKNEEIMLGILETLDGGDIRLEALRGSYSETDFNEALTACIDKGYIHDYRYDKDGQGRLIFSIGNRPRLTLRGMHFINTNKKAV